MGKDPNDIVELAKQSSPVDTSEKYDPSWVAGKTILITGGASGFGAGFSRHWAYHGANIIVADINVEQGNRIVEEMRKQTGSEHHHFVKCDVTDWQSQVDMFREAIKLSPHGGIDSVVANAGIVDNGPPFDEPRGLDVDEPAKPVWKAFDVNLTVSTTFELLAVPTNTHFRYLN
jgi:NAD(P)-dependent dehydrogenase (short-subunit alcohol dehydrogenase family)